MLSDASIENSYTNLIRKNVPYETDFQSGRVVAAEPINIPRSR